ncbi:MAG: 23S rRNA (adenine(2503)-C(2))-methyltransferase RlmN [Micrococcales bacterium]|nr:23S rRNA (adenine(2503)-C(2))-methyltransferase RlmN [Micrococcales bacterium]
MTSTGAALDRQAARPRGRPPRHLADLTPDARVREVQALGQPAFRARQLATHYFAHLTCDPADMTDVPAAVRAPLVAALLPTLLTPVRRLTADRGRTVKTLWRLADGAAVESVLMRYPRRATLCLSSQVGCALACAFCATGQRGLVRNLSTAEILEQVRVAARALVDGDVPGGPGRLSNVVFMGMGEPLANYARTLAALRAVIAPAPTGFGISARNVVVSTVGLVPGIDRLAAEGLPVTLAVSLHAPDDALRSELVPVNARWDVAQVLDAAHRYFEVTGRRVSVEYALMRDVNDQPWRADRLGRLLTARGSGWVHVNPIPLNPVPGSRWTASDADTQAEFVARLRAHGVPTTVRDTRGSDIDGACGQLAGGEDE